MNSSIINDHKLAKKIKQSKDVASQIAPAPSEIVPFNPEDVEMPELLPVVQYVKESGRAIEAQDALDDLKYSRETLQYLIGNGQIVLNNLIEVAILSANPRAFEVVSQLIKTLADTSTEAVNLQDKMLDIQIKTNIVTKAGTPGPDGQAPEMFEDTTTHLLEQLEMARKLAN